MEDEYLTLAGEGEGLYKEKGSKFLAFACPTSDEEEAKRRLEALRKRFHDARHHCYAYAFGPDGERFRANDDGEPSHSAGTPILNQIRSRGLTDTLVVVVRYFGGTKLGVSGLIAAYKAAAAEALDAAGTRKAVLHEELSFGFEYPDMNAVMKAVKDHGLGVLRQDYDATRVRMRLSVRAALAERVAEELSGVDSLDFDPPRR